MKIFLFITFLQKLLEKINERDIKFCENLGESIEKKQFCGSGFIESGSSISVESGFGYGSRVLMTKN
jgi:hypothetical protein